MDDLVVIILTLLVAGIGIIGQSKKRKAASQQPQTGKSPQNFWDLLESQMDPVQQQDEAEPEFDIEDEPIDFVPKTPEYQFKAENEGRSELKVEHIQDTSVDEIRKTKREKFPLKRAVIYSEILNRKYI